jgi:nucleolar protein 14
MADFSTALVDHLAHMAETKQPLTVIEQLIRHLHSLSRTYPSQIGNAFRKHLAEFQERDQPTAGDMILLTAIGSIYPTSDHWHQVVTPAITLLAKWLSLHSPTPKSKPTADTLRTGAFFVALGLKYQSYSKRYLPEAIRFTEHTLAMAQMQATIDTGVHVENLMLMAELYNDKSAFVQIFSSFLPLLKALGLRKPHAHLTLLLSQSRMKTRPLELHHHRPLPIRTSVPKFEESFNPDKHYDPDKERSDAKKLKAEYKRERKGAVRELRKDANFIAREQLKDKRIRDEEYEKKYRRLVAEVQNEEGAASKEYEREKRKRQSKK